MKGLKKFSERVYHIDKKVQMLQREGWRKMFDCYFLKQADMQKVKKGVFFWKEGTQKGKLKDWQRKNIFSQLFLSRLWRRSFLLTFEQISPIFLVFLFLAWNREMLKLISATHSLEVVRVYKAKPVLALSTSPTKSSSTLKQFVGNLPTNCFECVWPFCWVGA